MKINRIFVWIWMFCLLLTGCTNPGTGINESDAVSITPSSVMVHIEINPQFTLGLDENNMIVQVLCKNLDAKSLFEELDVLDRSYLDGMTLILNKAYEMEFIKSDTSEIKMEIVLVGNKVESKDELTKVLKQPMETFFAEKEFAIEVEVPDVMEGIEVKIDTSWMGGTTETYLKDNKKIKSIEYADTFSCCKEYNEKGKVIREIKITGGSDYSCKEFDDKGILTKSIWRDDESGSYIEDYYNENRKVTKQIRVNTDGSRSETLFWENQNLKSQRLTQADGNYFEFYNDENGKIEYDVWIATDGSRQETHYGANDNAEKMLFDRADGTYAELYFHENGNKKLEISIYPDGRYYEWHYHENGEIQKSISVEADGTRTENNYY